MSKGGWWIYWAGLEYRVFKHFAMGIAYNRLILDLEYDSGKSDGGELKPPGTADCFTAPSIFNHQEPRLGSLNTTVSPANLSERFP